MCASSTLRGGLGFTTLTELIAPEDGMSRKSRVLWGAKQGPGTAPSENMRSAARGGRAAFSDNSVGGETGVGGDSKATGFPGQNASQRELAKRRESREEK